MVEQENIQSLKKRIKELEKENLLLKKRIIYSLLIKKL